LSRVKVFFTVDVEIWPGGWTDIDARFPQAFRHYIYGDTAFGQYGLPLQLRVLEDHGLTGVFFVEPLFSARYGRAPLQEIVGLIQQGGQDVQLHLHAEWANEAREPVLPTQLDRKIQHLSHFSLPDQTALIGWARHRMGEAGAPVSAFRAGSFAFNADTLRALEANGLYVDSSYNHYYGGASSGVWDAAGTGDIPVEPFRFGKVLEFPVTIYRDFPFHVRSLQLKGCSLGELTNVLRRAAEHEHSTVVIVSHSFELLDRRDFSRDEIVARRFFGLCEFLGRNRDVFETCGFGGGEHAEPPARQPAPVSGGVRALGIRYMEQLRQRL
jgi:hypothetical protein